MLLMAMEGRSFSQEPGRSQRKARPPPNEPQDAFCEDCLQWSAAWTPGPSGLRAQGHCCKCCKFLQQVLRQLLVRHDTPDIRKEGGVSITGPMSMIILKDRKWMSGQCADVNGQEKSSHHLNDLCLTAVLLDKVFQTSVIVIRVKLAPKFHVSLVQVGKVRFNLQAVHVMGAAWIIWENRVRTSVFMKDSFLNINECNSPLSDVLNSYKLIL